MGRLASTSIAIAAMISMSLGISAAAKAHIEDPKAFVSDVYRHIATSEESQRPYSPPENIYSPRLKQLFASYRKRTGGQVSCLDFDFWVNAQDSKIENMSIATPTQAADRSVIVAKFTNGVPQQIEFTFKRIDGFWWLDEVRSLKRPQWILSELLRCR